MKGETKQEASIPVQSRINIAVLAELDTYWLSEGRGIRSMSQLVSWSLELLREILKANGKIDISIESVAQAHKYLLERNLYQPSLFNKRGFDKIGAAIMFENMREDGNDPSIKIGDPKEPENQNIVRAYNMLHNKRSIRPFNGRIKSNKEDEVMKIFNSLENVDPIISGIGNSVVKEKMTTNEFEDKMSELEMKAIEEQRLMDEFLVGQKKE
jgi:hypothetical protein